MFDLAANDGSVRRKAYNSPIPGDAAPKEVPLAELDGEKMVQLHHRLLDLYSSELDRQYDNRIEQAQEEDIYDNIQWTDEDAQTLRDRGQIPLVYNVVSASIDWVVGTEKRTRTDFKILPRRKEQGKPAERKTQLMKYLSDCNRSPFHTSRAFEDAVKIGIGWLEDGASDGDDGEPLFNRYESWRNMLWDSASTEMDIEDGRYVFRTKWADLDVAKAIFHDRAGLLDRSAADSNDYSGLDEFGDEVMDSAEISLDQPGTSRPSDRITGYQRLRVRLMEAWIKLPVDTYRIRGGDFAGELLDPYSVGHREAIESGNGTVTKKVAMRMHVAIFTTAGMLYFGPSPYRHNRFPLTPIFGYRRGRDGLPYGMMRRIKDIQIDVNKRASKALHILSTSKVVVEEGTVDDMDELQDEVARPDAFIVVKQGKLGSLDISADRELSQFHVELMSRSISMIQQAGGVTDENLGRRTNASSGIAIQRRQDQGALATAKLFDHLQFARQVQGEKQLANIEQFMSEKKAFRITNMRGNPEYIEINDGLPENDVTRSKADYVIGEADWQNTLREAAVSQLLETMSKLPGDIAIVFLDLVVENMDLPNRDEIVRRIRAFTGQRDPDAEEPTPEEQQQAAAKADEAALQKGLLAAQLRNLLANAAKTEAAAQQIVKKMVGDNVEAQNRALAAAREALLLPQAAPIADHILAESGFQSQSDLDAEVAAAAQQQAAAPVPAQPPRPGPAMQPTGLNP